MREIYLSSFIMEKENNVFETKVLHPMLVGDKMIEITDSILQSIIATLFRGLSETHKKVLMHQHFYRPDPNGYTEGKNISLIRLLLLRSGVSPSRIFLPSQFQIELFMYNLKDFTGICEFTALEKEIKEINEIWGNHDPLGRIASIQVEERDSAVPRAKKKDKQYFLKFELL
jgi:hypothetical protein